MATFMVIGADGREYGPATVETILHWKADGRVNPNTPVRSETGQMLTVAQLIPPPVLSVPAYGTHPGYPSYPQPIYAAPTPKPQFPALVLVLFGLLGTCVVGTLLSIAIPNFQKAKEVSDRKKVEYEADTKSFAAMQNARMVVSALANYAEMANARLPNLTNSDKVEDAISPYIPDPAVRADVSRYEFNTELSDRIPGRMTNPGQVWLLRDPQANDVGQTAVCMVDGECMMLTPSQFKYRCLPYHAKYQTTGNPAAPPQASR